MVEEAGSLRGYGRRCSIKDELRDLRVPRVFIQGDKDVLDAARDS
jgi:hypothetical protein